MGCKKILFIELDGATWDVITPLIGKGKLPSIKRLRDMGSSGILMSEHAAISPKIWTSMFAGKGHEKTGIDFFGGTSRMVKCKRLWDIFSENGYRVGVFGSFATWPPYEVNGFMIPAIDSVGTETYPPEYTVFQELALNERKKSKGMEVGSLPLTSTLEYAIKLKKIGVCWKTYLKVLGFFTERVMGYLGRPKDQHWKKVILHSEISADVFIHLCRRFRPDFATIHMHICDFLSHRYWMAYEPSKFPGIEKKLVEQYREVIPRGYIQADKAIGRILDSVGKEANIVLVSDHGFEAKAGGFNPHEISIDKLLEVLRLRGKVIGARFGPGVYINFQDEMLMHHAADVLAHAFSEETGEKVFHVRIFEKTLIVQKPMEKLNRDEILKSDSFIDFGEYGTHRALDLYVREKQMMSGVHAEEGVIVMCGPDIKSGARLENLSFYDIAPTVLWLMGLPVAKDMCGRAIIEAVDETYLRENPLKEIDTYEEGVDAEDTVEELDYGKIEERLKSLGYL
ncbi:MAG: alkaline phosphatase family protein [Deltaproteobacteria bacterium]|nr:alkaline phosphatase family protein [Deltaproteobacteria bacterium]